MGDAGALEAPISSPFAAASADAKTRGQNPAAAAAMPAGRGGGGGGIGAAAGMIGGGDDITHSDDGDGKNLENDDDKLGARGAKSSGGKDVDMDASSTSIGSTSTVERMPAMTAAERTAAGQTKEADATWAPEDQDPGAAGHEGAENRGDESRRRGNNQGGRRQQRSRNGTGSRGRSSRDSQGGGRNGDGRRHSRTNEKQRPTAGYTCKTCGKPGGESDSHWFQLCPMRPGNPPSGWTGARGGATAAASSNNFNHRHHRNRSNGGNNNGNHMYFQQHNGFGSASSSPSSASYSDPRNPRNGRGPSVAAGPRAGGVHGGKMFQPPKEGYVCKVCGKQGGEPDSHWFQQCPLSDSNFSGAQSAAGGAGALLGTGAGALGGATYSPGAGPLPGMVAGMSLMSVPVSPMNGYGTSPQMMYPHPHHPGQLYYMAPANTGQSQTGDAAGSPLMPGSPSSAVAGYYSSGAHYMYAPNGMMVQPMPGSAMHGSPMMGNFQVLPPQAPAQEEAAETAELPDPPASSRTPSPAPTGSSAPEPDAGESA